jgi:flagellin-like protein
MKKMRGIEPIIAVVILVAITLVIAIGVIGWLMGWWGGMGQVETLVIHPDSKLYADGKIELHVENKGTAAAVIYKVEIVGVGSADISPAETLSPGQETTIKVDVPNAQLVAGATYVVRVYTRAGNMYPVTLRAEVPPSQGAGGGAEGGAGEGAGG